ncbi:MAG: MFS transporter [Bauldia sp.]
MAAFFIQGTLLANWFPRIPDVQAKLGLGPAELAVGILGMPIGSFIALMVAGRIIEVLTPRLVIVLGTTAYCLAMSLPGWAWDIPSLFLGLMFLGALYVCVDVAINVQAAATQRRCGRRIMNTCHGFWSLGSMLGAIVGGGFAEYGVATSWHLLVVGLLTIAPALAIARGLPTLADEAAVAAARGPAFSLPSVAMLGLCVFAFGIVLTELATRTWAAVFLREVVAASPAATGLGYAGFSLAMAAGRFLGDKVSERIGAVAIARGCALAAIVGIVIVLTATTTTVAIVGLAVVGLGASVGYPLAVTAAAELGDRAAAINVSALALVAFSSSLVGPPLVGFVAEVAGLRIGLSVIVPFLLASALLAGELGRRARGLDAPRPSD